MGDAWLLLQAVWASSLKQLWSNLVPEVLSVLQESLSQPGCVRALACLIISGQFAMSFVSSAIVCCCFQQSEHRRRWCWHAQRWFY
jgi:hypothetical protein